MAKKNSAENENETPQNIAEVATEAVAPVEKEEPVASAPVAEPAFKVAMRPNGLDLESVNGQNVYFVGAHHLLRTPTQWADQIGLEPVWHPIPREGCAICPTTFKDAKGLVHPAFFMKTKTEIQLWMERK